MQEFTPLGRKMRIVKIFNVDENVFQDVFIDAAVTTFRTERISTSSELDVASLFNNEFLSDFKILCADDKVIRAHKIVLAMSSPVFNRMLQTDFKATAKCELMISDFAYEVVIEMLQFMYTGGTSKIDVMAIDLLKIAEKYELSLLKSRCEKNIIPSLSAKTALELLDFADTYNAAVLEKATIRFIMSNYTEIRDSSAYQSLSKHLLIKLCDAGMNYAPTK